MPPSKEVLAELRTRTEEAIDTGSDAERKALSQALVQEVTVTARDHIEPFFRVPQTADAGAVRAVERLVDLACLCTNTRWALVNGPTIEVSGPNTALRHGDGDR